MSEETWMDIDGYNGYYQVSDFGRIRSTGSRARIRQLYPNKKWKYLYVVLFKKGHRVHRLVAKAFIPNPHNKSEVNHIDGNKNNNHISNLEWVTPKENMMHACSTGIKKPSFGRRKLSWDQVNEIRYLLYCGATPVTLAKEFSIERNSIYHIQKHKSWIQ